jgi:hypothetical protein
MVDINNYPDVLGSITKGQRANIGVIQIASTLRPRVIMAGRPLEMLLLLQNAADTEVAVQATLKLPQLDAKKQKGRFISKADMLNIKLGAAAVGLVTLPLTTLPDIAVGAGYKIGMEVKIAQTGNAKPNRVRQATGGGEFELDLMTGNKRQLVEQLSQLPWNAALSGSMMESSLTVMSGKVGSFADLEPSFTSLWTPSDYGDDTFVLHSIGSVLIMQLLPTLKRVNILPIMREYTAKRFANVGYPLTEDEVDIIARYLTYILEQAAPAEKEAFISGDSPYSLRRYFTPEGTLKPVTERVKLPYWVTETARAFATDSRVAQFPLKAIGHFAYDGLLKDAMLLGFQSSEELLGHPLGTPEEALLYTDRVFEGLTQQKLSFDLLYLPLMMGAMANAHQIVLKTERPANVVMMMRRMMDDRNEEQNDETMPVYRMATRILESVATRYGSSDY